MNGKLLATYSISLGLMLSAVAPAYAADAPCGKLVGTNAPGNANESDAGFTLRDGEAVDFISGGQTTHGKLLVFTDGQLFRAYWQPQNGQEKYALANAGPNKVRLVSTPPQGKPATDGKPGIMTQPMLVLSCPKL